MYSSRMTHQKSAVYLLLLPIFAIFSTLFAKSAKNRRGLKLANQTGLLLASSKKLQAVNEMHSTPTAGHHGPKCTAGRGAGVHNETLSVTAITSVKFWRPNRAGMAETNRGTHRPLPWISGDSTPVIRNGP